MALFFGRFRRLMLISDRWTPSSYTFLTQRQNQSAALEDAQRSDDEQQKPTKIRPVKFEIPPNHTKAKMSVLCVVPIKQPNESTLRADDLSEIRSNLKELLNIEGLLFWGASVNGRAMRRKEFVEWTKLDPERTKALVPTALQRAMLNGISNLEKSGIRIVTQLETLQQQFIGILTHLETQNQSTTKMQ